MSEQEHNQLLNDLEIAINSVFKNDKPSDWFKPSQQTTEIYDPQSKPVINENTVQSQSTPPHQA